VRAAMEAAAGVAVVRAAAAAATCRHCTAGAAGYPPGRRS
jgi:hypothetical protein